MTLNDDGTIEYTPEEGFIGTDTFTYVVTDGSGPSAPGTVSVDIAPAPPIINSPVEESRNEEDASDSTEEESSITVGPSISPTESTSSNDEDADILALLNDSFTTDDNDEEIFVLPDLTSLEEESDQSLNRLSIIAGSSYSDSIELVTPDRTTNPALESIDVAELQTLDFAQYVLEGQSYTAILQGMDQMRESLDSEVVLPELAMEGLVAATSSFSVGAALWFLRGGYIVASVISALPAWQTFDPIPILAYATKEEGETVESLMEG